MRRRGFTLIELLIVVAILAVLAALIFPALARGRSTAQRINCLSNLRQMTLAAQVYTDDNRGAYPVAYTTEVRNGITYTICWDFTASVGNPSTVEPGLLWGSQGANKVQQCPAYRGKANWSADPFTGYNYNTSYIGHGEHEAIPVPAKAADIRKPSQTLLFGDGEYGAGADKFMRAPWPNAGDQTFKGRWAGTQGFRHTGQSNAAFCDGHAEAFKNRWTDNQDGADKVATGTGFLTPDNSLYDLE